MVSNRLIFVANMSEVPSTSWSLEHCLGCQNTAQHSLLASAGERLKLQTLTDYQTEGKFSINVYVVQDRLTYDKINYIRFRYNKFRHPTFMYLKYAQPTPCPQRQPISNQPWQLSCIYIYICIDYKVDIDFLPKKGITRSVRDSYFNRNNDRRRERIKHLTETNKTLAVKMNCFWGTKCPH